MNSPSSNQKHSSPDKEWANRSFDGLVKVGEVAFKVVSEIVKGFFNGTFPYFTAGIALLVDYYVLRNHYDYGLFRYFGMESWYPTNHSLYSMYYYFWVTFPIWSWGLYRVGTGQRLRNTVTNVSQSIGLKNGVGKTPTPVFDSANHDGTTRTLRLQRAGLPLQDFQKAKQHLEGAMNVYIDEVKENRTAGTVDIVYSKDPLTNYFEFTSPYGGKTNQFIVGTTRTSMVFGSLKQTPHLLIAGQTGGGKSTFLRQFNTMLYLNNPNLEMTLIDLKGGLEFQLFENLPRVQVIPDLEQAVRALKLIQEKLNARMAHLKQKGLASIDQVGADKARYLVVVDEAAEILSSHDLAPAELNEARSILSQIARQGRAVGIHLVLATQRPDSRALDTQVKSNLTGILCFPMPNNTSSVTVLDSARAATLADIPGRALWKNGPSITELQTPHLSIERAAEYLEEHRKPKTAKTKTTDTTTASNKSGSLEIEN